MSRRCVLSWGAVFTAAMFWAGGAAADFEPATVFAREAVVTTGKTQTVDINVEVKPGYHVQANPASFDNLIPLTLTLWPTSGVAAGSPHLPGGEENPPRGKRHGTASVRRKVLGENPNHR